MKAWQAEAIKKIDVAARKLKHDVVTMGPKAKYDYVEGELEVRLVEEYPDGYTLTRTMIEPL